MGRRGRGEEMRVCSGVRVVLLEKPREAACIAIAVMVR